MPVPGDGIEDDEDLSHDGDKGDLSGSAVLFDELLIEGLEDGVVADSGSGGVEEHLSHARAAMADAGLGFRLAAFAVLRSEADERGDLFARETAEFGKVGEEGGGGYRSDAFEALQQGGAAGGVSIIRNGGLDGGFDGFQVADESLDGDAQAMPNGRDLGAIETAALGMQAADELTPPGGELAQGRVAADGRADGASGARLDSEVGDEAGIDTVGLGADATALTEGDKGVGMNPERDDGAGTGIPLRSSQVGALRNGCPDQVRA